MESNSYEWIEQKLDAIRRVNWYRSVKTIQSRPGASIILDDHEVINFASNDYLGLAGDKRLAQAAITAIQEFGTGSTGSRLATGHRVLHRRLELAISELKQTEDSIVFSSGYLANLGAISTLVGSRDLILADQYNHASLKDGAVLSKAKTVEYAHCNLEDLIQKLSYYRSSFRRCLIVTDGVFSMDGDICPLPGILDAAEQFNCMVLVDDAHGTGVLGANGTGCVEHLGCINRSLIQVGTLSKSLGSLGGYITGSKSLIDFLRNRTASWIYTTGLSPADTAAALTAIEILHDEPERRTILWQNIETLNQLLDQNFSLQADISDNLKRLPSESSIICLQVKDIETVLSISHSLRLAGVFVGAVRPPTVPTSRLRISVMATHNLGHLQKLVTALFECMTL